MGVGGDIISVTDEFVEDFNGALRFVEEEIKVH